MAIKDRIIFLLSILWLIMITSALIVVFIASWPVSGIALLGIPLILLPTMFAFIYVTDKM